MNKTYLVHHGIKGQRWGVRRFQNEDGSLTSAGKKKYNVNEDGTVNMKDSYRKGQNVRGAIKGLAGAALVTRGVTKLGKSNEMWIDKTAKGYKKDLNSSIFKMTLGAIVISSAAKSFINANKNRTFNSTGMGATPETFTGKPKTVKQVLAAQKRANNKK